MRGMDLGAGKARLLGNARGMGKAGDDLVDVLLGHCRGRGKHLRVFSKIERHGGRRPGLLAQVLHDLPARVIELQPHLRAFGLTDPRPFAERGDIAFVLEHDATRSGHGAAIDHHIAGQNQARAAFRPSRVELHQIGGRRMGGVGHVFLHRRLGDAVLKDAPIGERKRVERGHCCTGEWTLQQLYS